MILRMPEGSVRPIVVEPDERLHMKSVEVKSVDKEVRELMADMFQSMRKNPDAVGIGLAAVQIGVLKCVIVVDAKTILERDEPSTHSSECNDILYIANPKILTMSEEQEVCSEGCLSYPGISVEVSRPLWVELEYLDEWNKTQKIKAYGLLGRCILHEIDHTKGKVLPDYLSFMRRKSVLKMFRKLVLEKKRSNR